MSIVFVMQFVMALIMDLSLYLGCDNYNVYLLYYIVLLHIIFCNSIIFTCNILLLLVSLCLS